MIDTLASQTILLLVSYLKKTVRGIGGKIYEIVREKFTSDPILNDIFNRFEQTPESFDRQEKLKSEIESIMKKDKDFMEAISTILDKNAHDAVSVIQKTEIHGDVEKNINFGNVTGPVNIN